MIVVIENEILEYIFIKYWIMDGNFEVLNNKYDGII